ncbi:exonuclease family [Nautilia profundicola AmH]|uniref:Exonuclease family n=1 Tax=Nautilia profundicola (strain ATCC BAA-1463 / DSM 18972 / AmH) TaxID=598659 RepID=B9L7I4_NAUPA|nr:3'-5' exonuclease [Nautilia profundicola]ACM93645.1 exonuclease family [Nautilia profundicola AmH]
MSLPQKIETLRLATVFNKKTREYAIEKLKKDKSYLLKCLSEDVKEDVIFRNYNDYLTSVVLEEEGKRERIKPIKRQKVFSTKEFLKFYIHDLENTPDEFKIQKVGVFDTETTDIYGYIISYAVVIQDMQSMDTEEIYDFLNPKAKISEEAYEVHKIKQEDIEHKPTFAEKKDEFLQIFDNLDMVVGHNVLYDFGVLKRELERAEHFPNIIDIPIFDTMYYSADVVVLEKKKMPRLEECVAFFFGKQNANYHDALEDVKMTLKVFNRLLQEK